MVIKTLVLIGVFMLGAFIGGAVKGFLDNDEIYELEKQNARLHKELKTAEKRETVKIVDGTVGAGVDFSQKW